MDENYNKLLRGRRKRPSPLLPPDRVALHDLSNIDEVTAYLCHLGDLSGTTVSAFLSGSIAPTPLAEGQPTLIRKSSVCSQFDADTIYRHWECALAAAKSDGSASSPCICGGNVLCYPLSLRHDGRDWQKAQICFSLCPPEAPSVAELASTIGIPEDKAGLVRELLLQKSDRNTTQSIEDMLAVSVNHLSNQISAAYATQCAADECSLAREVLDQEDAWFSSVTSNLPDIIWTIDLNHRIHYVSESVYSITGYTPDEVIGHSVSEFVSAEMFEPISRGMAEGLECERKGVECVNPSGIGLVSLVRKDGSTYFAETRSSFMRDQDGEINGVVGVTRDVTEREAIQQALRESEEKFRMLTENASVGVYILDQDYKYIYVNPRLAEMLGYTPEEIIGHLSVNEVVAAESLESVRVNLGKRFNGTAKGNHYALKAVRKDGEIVDCEVFVSVVSYEGRQAVCGTAIDVTDRKRAEEALRESENKYRTIFDAVADGIVITDLQGNYRAANAAYCGMLGYSFEELVGRSVGDFFASDKKQSFSEKLEEVRERGEVRFESERKGKDGKRVYVEVYARRFSYDGSPAYLGVIHDITERRNAEDSLRQEHAFRKALEDSTPTGVVAMDLEGRRTYVNRAFCEMVGWSEEELNADPSFAPYWPPEEYASIEEGVRRTLAGDIPPEGFELRCLKRSGERFDVNIMPAAMIDDEGRFYGWMMCARDITDRKRAEAELSWLASFPERNPQPIAEIDLSGHVCYLNSALRSICPDLRETGTDHPWLVEWDSVVKSLSDGKKKMVRDINLGEASYQQVIVPVEELKRIRIYGADVSARRRAQDELRRRADRLESQHAKLKATTEQKANFFASMSHELRTPMTSVIGFTELLLEDLEDPVTSGQRELLLKVSQNARRLLGMVNDLLDLARLESRRVTPVISEVDLTLLAEQVVSNMRPLAKDKELELLVISDRKAPLVYTDEQKLGQILVNLLSNAMKFTPSGRIQIDAKATDTEITVSVSDTGIGIPRSERRKIFEEFHSRTERGKHRMPGTGLGLPITKRLCELLRGKIKVTSEVGHGSTFTVTLPNHRP